MFGVRGFELDLWEKIVIGVVSVGVLVLGYYCWRILAATVTAFREGMDK